MELKPKNKEKLKALVSNLFEKATSAYIDSYIYLTSYNSELSTRQDCFVFRYTFYSIRERLIIATKKLIEPAHGNKITMFSISKIVNHPEFCDNKNDRDIIKHIFTDRLQELFASEYSIRLKNMRDVLCHNIYDNVDEPKCYCKDFMFVIQGCLKILLDIREHVLGLRDINFQQIKDLAYKLAKDYWKCINTGASETQMTQDDLQLVDLLMGNVSKNNPVI